MQLAALGTTLGIALVGGAVSGVIASKAGGKLDSFFDDQEHFVKVDYSDQISKYSLQGPYAQKE